MNLKNIIVMILGGIFILGAGVGVYIFSKKEILPNITVQEKINSKELSAETIALLESYKGITPSSTIKGYKTYTNKKYGFQFTYPKEWRIDRSDSISVDINSPKNYSESFTFKNYLKSEEEETGFRGNDGKNKIDFSVVTNNRQSTSTDGYTEEGEKPLQKQMIIAGQSATKVEFERRKGYGLYLSYSVPIPNSNNHLAFIMYGDPINFHQLDELVKTIKWLPVENK